MKHIIKRFAGCCVALLWGLCLAAQPALTRVEYYIDTDPGYGSATSVGFTTGATNLSNVAVNIDPGTLIPGVHVFGIRAKDVNGAWSLDNKWLFVKPYSNSTAIPNVSRVEYYIDTDPGYGAATSVSIGTGNNFADLTVNIDPATLTAGVHVFGIRSKDANGAWSLDNKWLFVKPYSNSTAIPNVSRVEYYIDTDPGYDNATSVSIGTGTDFANLTVNIDPATLTSGVHVFGIRAKDINGAWSLDNKWLFIKPLNNSTVAPNLSRIEYYFDTDPGYGNGVPVAINNITNLPNYSLPVNISGLSAGAHKLFMRSKDVNNAWSLDNIFEFTVTAAIANPSIVVNSVTKKTVCAKDGFNVSYQANGTYNAGNVFNVQISDATGSFTSPVTIGSFAGTGNSIISCALPASVPAGTGYKVRVTSTNPVVTGITGSDVIIINALPAIPTITPSGTTTFCAGGSVTLTSSSATNYLWSNGATTQSINVTASGNYSVIVSNASGCTAASNTVTVTVNPKPAPVITPSGVTTNLCPGATVTLDAGAGYTTYLWSNAATTQSVLVSTAGNYTVTVSNAYGCNGTSTATNVTYVACPKPTGLKVTVTSATTATLKWKAPACGVGFQLQLRAVGAATWTTIPVAGLTYKAKNLLPATAYEWQVATVCQASPQILSVYAVGANFTTPAAAFSEPVAMGESLKVSQGFNATVFPNPSRNNPMLRIEGAGGAVNITLTDMAGKVLWKSLNVTDIQVSLPTDKLAQGVYLVNVTNGRQTSIVKIVKE
ncbi:MAG: T9SS type A sorting domain-containing protein [Panacibacter sp.]